jgi:hypothetical protein
MSGSKSLSQGAEKGESMVSGDGFEPADHPLGMTVYDLPDPASPEAKAATLTRTGRIKMFLVLLVCAAPVVASYFTYYVIRPEGRRNYGELIEPMRPLPAVQAVQVDGKPLELTALQHQWLLISVADSACNAMCERHLYLQRQIREALGKDKTRLDWVWLRTGQAALSDELQRGTAAATVLKVEEPVLSAWLEPAPGRQLADHLYLVDPWGNWMMRFPADADPTKVRKDIERLLRAAASWDKEGRP